MMRLVKAGLMFGNLYEVSSPALDKSDWTDKR